jgi:hypothetical protein
MEVVVELFDLIDNFQSFQPPLFKPEKKEIPKPTQEQCTICATKPPAPRSIHPYINEATLHCPAPPIRESQNSSSIASSKAL